MKAALGLLLAVGLATAYATALPGQAVSPSCPPGSTGSSGGPDVTRQAQDACQKAIDLFQFLAPQLGISLTGGNVVLGEGAAFRGLGRVSMGVRANVVRGTLPEVDKVVPSVDGARRDTYPTKERLIGLPTADVALGVLGRGTVVPWFGGFDLLVSAAYVPPIRTTYVEILVPKGGIHFGYGARLSLIAEGRVVPGVAVSYLTRGLPTIEVVGSTTQQDTLRLTALDVRTASWRVTASKRVGFLGLAVGGGGDSYDTDASVSARVSPRSGPFPTSGGRVGPIPLTQTMSRFNYFADVSLNLGRLALVGEAGQVSGGDVQTFNQFAGRQADDARPYAAVGLKLGI